MTLFDMSIDQCGTIKNLAGGDTFKRRLRSLGVTKGSEFVLKAATIMRNVYEIELNSGTCVALRRGEALKIEVEPCKK